MLNIRQLYISYLYAAAEEAAATGAPIMRLVVGGVTVPVWTSVACTPGVSGIGNA
jgi:hypothetical protein